MSDGQIREYKDRIKVLLQERNAVLVAHYYTDDAIQALAEETGGCVSDSLEMARFGNSHDAEILIVAGVRFMGETAKILNPEKRVLMPTLRERSEDIILLSHAFLREFSSENNKDIKPLSDDALKLLRSYAWPGNVRELRTAIEHGVVMSNDAVIGSNHLPYFLSSSDDPSIPDQPILTVQSAKMGEKDENSLASEGEFNLHVLEMHTIRRALQRTDNNRTDAARLLGISRRTLQRKLKKLESKP